MNAQEHFVNLIQASEEIIKLRREEFNIIDLHHLNDLQISELRSLLQKYFQVFSSSPKTLGHTDKIIPDLQFHSNYPVKALPLPIPFALHEETKNQLNILQEAGIITKSISQWSSPLLLVKKKQSAPNAKPQYRLTIDMRLINSLLKQSNYPLPIINNILTSLSKYKYFSSLDFSNAFWQISLPEKYRDILTFSTPFGAYKFNRLIFGLKNSSALFQSMIDSIIEESSLEGVYAFQDDVIVGANSFKETTEKLTKLFELFLKYNLTLSPNKCSFHKNTINYLGFNIKQNKISPLQSNIEKITAFALPNTATQLKKFIGLANFYRSLIPNFAILIKPLIEAATSKNRFKLLPHHVEAFKKIQNIFFNSPFIL